MDEQPITNELTQEQTADDAAAEVKPPFNWGKFFGFLGSVLVVAILVGAGAAFWYGRKPLERKAQELAVRITRVEFDWPAIGAMATKPGTKAEAAKKPDIVEAAKAKPNDKKNKSKKPAATPEPAPLPEPEPVKTWLPEQFQEQLLTLAKKTLGEDPDPLSREPLDRVAAAMESTGWFVGKPAVTREPEGVLRVHGVWRLPAAVIRQPSGDHLVSWEGLPMPVTYKPDQSKLPVLHGVPGSMPTAASKPDYSQVWPGDEVGVSLELLKLIADKPWASQVVGLDSAAFATTKRLTMLTRRGGRVVWGGRASKPLWGEISTSAKLDRLAELNRKFGSIDANIAEGSALEIFWERPLVLNISASNTGPLVEETAR